MTYPQIAVDLLRGAETTLVIAVGAWIVGLAIGLALALVRSSSRRSMIELSRFVILVLRSMPPLVVLYLVYFGLSAEGISIASIPAAILALGLSEASFMAEYYRAGFTTVGEQQRDAGFSLGLSRLEVFLYVVIPQTIPFLIPLALNSLIGLLKTATLASAVGAPEILYQGQAIIERAGYIVPVAVTIIVLYVAVTLPLAHLVSRLERRAQSFRRARTA